MDPRGRQRKMEKVFMERFYSTYSWPGSGFDAYLRYFREGSVRERRDLTRLGALFVGAHGPRRSRSSQPRLRRGVAPETSLRRCPCLPVATYESSEGTPLFSPL
jgi:hypothetical protein